MIRKRLADRVRGIRRSRTAVTGLVLVFFPFALAVYGLTIDPYPARSFPCLGTCAGLPPFTTLSHPFGTYPTGQDVFSEVAHGAPSDLFIGFGATAVAVLIGTVLGMFSGYRKGLGRDALLSVFQVVLLLPSFVMVVWFYTTYGGSDIFASSLLTGYLALLLGVFAWPPIAFVVGNAVTTAMEEGFVEGARAVGAGRGRILFRHVLPNIATPLLSMASIVFAANITAESLFAYLGLVSPQSDTVTWGFLLWEGRSLLIGYWWISFFPGAMIVVTVLGFSLLADTLSEELSPKLRAVGHGAYSS